VKRSKKIYLLLAVLAVVCLATFALSQTEKYGEKVRESNNTILAISADTVKTLSWEYNDNNFAFNKEEKWLYAADNSFPVDQEKIGDLLKVFEKLVAAFAIEDVEDYGQYGLDKPTCTINIDTAEKSYKVLLGDFSKMDSQRYVSIGDGNVYLVKEDPLEKFDAGLSDLIDNDETPELTDKLKEIKFAGAENYRILYEKDSPDAYKDGDIYFAQVNGSRIPLNNTKVNNYLLNIKYLKLKDYVTYKATAEDLQKYGLDAPELKVTASYTAENEEGEEKEETFILNISRDPAERKAAEEAAAKAGEEENKKEGSASAEKDEEKITAYARVGESGIIYKITPEEYKKLIAASVDSFRHPEVLPVDLKQIRQIDISLEGKSHTITSKGDDDDRKYYYQDEEIEFKVLQNALKYLRSEEFTDKVPDQKLEISLKVYLDNENYPEMQVRLYRHDGTYCLAEVDGKPLSFVKRSNVIDLIEAVHAIVLNK